MPEHLMQPTILILAAGAGTRFRASGGQTHKLQAPLLSRKVLEHVIACAQDSGMAWHVVDRKNGGPGMGDSIAAGIAATAGAGGWLILPGDLPLVLPATLRRVAQALEMPGIDVVTPHFQGRQGHPVAFHARCLHALLALHGDKGASSIVRAARETQRLLELALDDEGIVMDVDTVQDLQRAEALLRTRS